MALKTYRTLAGGGSASLDVGPARHSRGHRQSYAEHALASELDACPLKVGVHQVWLFGRSAITERRGVGDAQRALVPIGPNHET